MSEEVKPEITSEEQPAATEQPAAEEQPKTDDQPAVTEVTEVTEKPAAAAEGEAKPEEKKEEPKKKEPKPKVEKPPPNYRTVKAGWIERPGIFLKSFKRLYMSLDEEGSVLRWWKNEERTSSDGALFMKYCAEVTEPNEQFNTTWPEGTDERRFVISSPHRAFYILAENAEDKSDWIQKLREAMDKYKEAGVKVITTNPMSVESLKATFTKAADEAETTLEKEGVATKKTEETPKAEGEAAAAAPTEEPKPEGETKTEVTIDVQVEKTEGGTEEEKPAEGEATKAD